MPGKQEHEPVAAEAPDYIPGVYNYCDRWCSACPASARCRVFQEEQASSRRERDAGTTAMSFPAQVGHWLQRALELLREKARAGADGDAWWAEPSSAGTVAVTPFVHGRLVSRADAYRDLVFAWQAERPIESRESADPDPAVPQDVIDHFVLLIGSKVQRAVTSLEWERQDPSGDWPRDSDGSAKVAVLGAQRSLAAWRDLRDSGLASDAQIDACVEKLGWLIRELDRVFPSARSFIRPGLEEEP